MNTTGITDDGNKVGDPSGHNGAQFFRLRRP